MFEAERSIVESKWRRSARVCKTCDATPRSSEKRFPSDATNSQIGHNASREALGGDGNNAHDLPRCETRPGKFGTMGPFGVPSVFLSIWKAGMIPVRALILGLGFDLGHQRYNG